MLKRRGRIDEFGHGVLSPFLLVCESVWLIVSALCSKGRLPSSAILAQLLAPFDCGACLMTDKWVLDTVLLVWARACGTIRVLDGGAIRAASTSSTASSRSITNSFERSTW